MSVQEHLHGLPLEPSEYERRDRLAGNDWDEVDDGDFNGFLPIGKLLSGLPV